MLLWTSLSYSRPFHACSVVYNYLLRRITCGVAMEYKFILFLLLGSFTVHGLSEEDKKVLLEAHNYCSLASADAANMERVVSVLLYSSHTIASLKTFRFGTKI